MRKFIEKIGMDKAAHFGVGGLVTALFTMVFILQDLDILILSPWRAMLYPIIGVVVTAFVSVIKEVFVDDHADWWDVIAALVGSALVFAAVLVGVLFCTGGN